MDSAGSAPPSPEGEFREGPGFKPESTNEIIKDLKPGEENKPNSLGGFLRRNALKLAPLALLLATATGKYIEGNSDVQMSEEDHQAVATWQIDAAQRIDNYEHDARSNMVDQGQLVNRDVDGKVVLDGYIDVTNYPAGEFPDGAKPEVIAKIQAGTNVNRVVEREPQVGDGNKEQDMYGTFKCESLQGEYKNPTDVEKTIELPSGTICVVKWGSVHSLTH